MSRPQTDILSAVALGTTRLDHTAAGEVMTLQRAAWVSEARANDTHDIPPLTETLETITAGLSDPAVLHWGYRDVAGRLLGMVRTTPTGIPGQVELGRLGVVPDLRGTGIGAALLALGETRAPADVTHLMLITGDRSLGNHAF